MPLIRRMAVRIDKAYMGFLFWATSEKSAAYLLTIMIFTAIALDPPQSLQAAMLDIISVYYQGVALPALGAASKRSEEAAKQEGAETRRLLQETHDVALKEHTKTRDMVVELHAMHSEKLESDRHRDERLDAIEAKQDLIIKLLGGAHNRTNHRT